MHITRFSIFAQFVTKHIGLDSNQGTVGEVLTRPLLTVADSGEFVRLTETQEIWEPPVFLDTCNLQALRYRAG
jgi:hypothetical protein